MSVSAEARIDIDAALAEVWAIILDLPRYGAWNPFVVGIDGPSTAPGSVLRVRARWEDGGDNVVRVVVTRAEPPAADATGTLRATLAYELIGALPRLGLLRSRRTQSLTQAPNGPTRYESREDFEGLMRAFVPRAKVQRGFEVHAAALKARAESGG
ncbi:MAG: SRPBCC domain-containing protein [Polyangiales bacterium]